MHKVYIITSFFCVVFKNTKGRIPEYFGVSECIICSGSPMKNPNKINLFPRREQNPFKQIIKLKHAPKHIFYNRKTKKIHTNTN